MGLRDIGRALASAALALALAPEAKAHEHETPEARAEAKKHKDAPRSFESKPALGTWATCPVSGETFQISEDTEFSTWRGRTYAFCCPDCKGDFDKHPTKFSVRRKS